MRCFAGRVEVAGFEPATTCSQSRCATKLRYTSRVEIERRMQDKKLMRRVLGLDEEEKNLLLWRLLGVELRPWTEDQETAWMLDVLLCPLGHHGPFSYFYIDGRTSLFVEEDGTFIPPEARESDGFDLPDYGGVYCERCGRITKEGSFQVPMHILKAATSREM